MRRVLVVANRTVGGAELAAAIGERIAAGPCEFHLARAGPADAADRHRRRVLGDGGRASCRRCRAPTSARSPSNGCASGWSGCAASAPTVDGEVGDTDAVRAVKTAIEAAPVDEIIISTLPTTISRWLRQDLPHRVERKFTLPVTVVTAATAPADS